MEPDIILNVVTTLTVLGGLLFAIFEVQNMRARRRQSAALALVRSYQTPEFSNAIVKTLNIPNGLTRKEVEGQLKGDLDGVWLLMTTWESLGILVHHREISLKLVEDFFSGPITLSWLKFQTLVEEMRRELDRETYFEWFQWLAERVMERETSLPPVPAHIEYHDWRF
jgi:hypothetical protein